MSTFFHTFSCPLRKRERLEIEEWTRRFKKMRREAKHLEHQERLREMRVEMVKQAIEESKDFITAENLDEKIAFALDNETSYNFALKPNGERIYSTEPPGNMDPEQPGPAAYVFPSSYFEKRPEKNSQEY
ncbi:hypothetical protein AC249_AIPGENE23128 [Exaiptasia diaphana]|nr:hypothetical protein AC249_AIPGENE23128 [Exaiptasia diaphana]